MPEDTDGARERGWYLDPERPHSHRFWTGKRWVSLAERLPDLAHARRPEPVLDPGPDDRPPR